jgi:hypothetical protein
MCSNGRSAYANLREAVQYLVDHGYDIRQARRMDYQTRRDAAQRLADMGLTRDDIDLCMKG